MSSAFTAAWNARRLHYILLVAVGVGGGNRFVLISDAKVQHYTETCKYFTRKDCILP